MKRRKPLHLLFLSWLIASLLATTGILPAAQANDTGPAAPLASDAMMQGCDDCRDGNSERPGCAGVCLHALCVHAPCAVFLPVRPAAEDRPAIGHRLMAPALVTYRSHQPQQPKRPPIV